MSFEWKIYVRDANYNRIGELDDYQEATLTPVYNDVGTWQITIDRRSDQAAALVTPGNGIMVVRAGASANPLFSGPYIGRHDTVTASDGTTSTSTQTIVVTGVTDDVWLKRRVASPSPAESSPPYSQASDDLTGVASTVLQHYVDVNAGPSAIGPRRVPGLTIATDPLLGASVAGSARWQNLLAMLQPLALAGNVGFRVVQVGTGLQFQVYQGTDRTGTVKFSIPLGTLAGFEYQNTAPTADYVYVGGSGDGTARALAEQSNGAALAVWGRIEGDLVNSSNTADATKMAQDGADALNQGAGQTSLSITPIESAGLRYGIDYFLGDKISAQIEGPGNGTVQDILRTVPIHLTVDGPQTVTPSIGTAQAADVFRIAKTFRVLATAMKRITNLERH